MAEAATAPTGSLGTAIAHARRLLARDPCLAEQQAREIIRVMPGSAAAHALLGRAYGLQERDEDAGAALRRAVWLDRDCAEAWQLLGTQLLLAGDEDGARRAHAEEMRASASDPRLQQAATALLENDIPTAEHLLRARLRANPADAAALRMLAEVGGRIGRYADARAMLAHALELSPSFAPARFNLALVLYRMGLHGESIAELDHLLRDEPDNPGYRNLKAAVLTGVGELDGALKDFEAALAVRPDQPTTWMSYGHSLKTAGRQADSIAAYRRALALDPRLGESWWSLANLKTVRFSDADVAAMQAAATRDDLRIEDRFHLEFALGKAFEDARDAERAFGHYLEANRLRRSEIDHDADALTARVARAERTLTADFFAARSGWGCDAPDPIFILGMPRAGSTLVEQILASHSAIEGTQELPDILALARQAADSDGDRYPETLAELTPQRAERLGREYLDRTRVQRRKGLPFFIDKMPNNWQHIGFIQLILPNAKIIDARRAPLDCCFSNFKQHFARGQHFAYDLEEMGRYYADYVRLMDHYGTALPGRVHLLQHEALVEDTEFEVRRLLDYLDLPFEESCLRFHENARPVRTASSEQVRRPINREGFDQWRPFEPWLGPLTAALGIAT